MPPHFGDSVIDSVAKVVLGILRRDSSVDYRALYGATILFSDGNRATVRPDSADIGESLSDCIVRRPEGLTIVPTPGTLCLLGWVGGDPSKRYVLLGADVSGSATSWSTTASLNIDLVALTINAGTAPATGFLATAAHVVAVSTVFTAIGAYAAAVAVVLPVTAPAAAALATALATYAGALASYSTTRLKGT
jgi:hypothetical protein